MNTEILGIILMYGLTVALAIPLGRYIGKVYEGEGTWLDRLLNPLDKMFYKLGGINPGKEMNWKQHMVALLTINLVWFVLSMLMLMNMSWLPFNPDGNPSMSADLAYNSKFCFQYKPAALFRRNRCFLSRSADPDVVSIHQRWYRHGCLCSCVYGYERTYYG